MGKDACLVFLNFLLPFALVRPPPQGCLEFQACAFGAEGGSAEPPQLSLRPAANSSVLAGRPSPGDGEFPGRWQRFLKAPPLTWEKEVPLQARARYTAAPSPILRSRNPPALDSALDSPRKKGKLSTRSPRPRSRFSYRDPTLHPFSCFPSPPIRPVTPKEEKPDGTVASWWWNEVAHCPAAWVPRCLRIPQPRLCNNTWDNQSHPHGLGPLRPPPLLWNRKP